MNDAYLEQLYFDPYKAGSFSGIDAFYEEIIKDGNPYNLKKSQVKTWLQSRDTYTLQKNVKRSFKRNKVTIYDINTQWDADLAVMEKYKSDNDGYAYILFVIDIFSRFLRTVALKTRQCSDMTNAFKSIFNEAKPKLLRTDAGSEFICQSVKQLLKEDDIGHIITRNEQKAQFAEVAIKNIKSRLFKYFMHKGNKRWIDVLEQFTDSYNRTYHSSIRRAPITVNATTRDEVWATQNILPVLDEIERKKKKIGFSKKKMSKHRLRPFKYKIGDHVRISHLRKTFERGYDQKFSGEIFKVTQRSRRDRIPIYKISDYSGEPIVGTFYEPELQKVTLDENASFKIEKVLKTRKRKGKKEYFVKWLYYPKKFNSWVTEDELQNE